MRESLGVMCFTLSLLIGTACSAATLEPVQGDLSINQGQGFQKVDSRIDANVGDSVMVGPAGSATVSYPDGCKVDVQPGAVMTIAPLSPCASGSYAADSSDLTGALIGGTLFAAGIGAGIVGITQSSSSSPASP
jgi:hypothetical protein